MSGDKKTRPDAATSERASGKAGSNSNNHYTADFTVGQIRISDFLSRGQENAVPLRQLKLTTGFDGRTIRRMIQQERLGGVPILADCHSGYFLPLTETEKHLCVRSMFRRASEIEKSAAAIFAAEVGPVQVVQKSSAPPTQETIPGWGNV